MITVQGRGTRTSWTPELKQISAGGTVGNTGWNALAGQSWYTYAHGTVTAVGMMRGPVDWGATFTSGYEWAINYPSGLTPKSSTVHRIIGRADQTTYFNRGADFILSMYNTGGARNSSYPIRLICNWVSGVGTVIVNGDNASYFFPQFFGDYGGFIFNMQYECDV